MGNILVVGMCAQTGTLKTQASLLSWDRNCEVGLHVRRELNIHGYVTLDSFPTLFVIQYVTPVGV